MSEKLKSYFHGFKYSVIEEEFPDKEKFPLYYTASRHEFTIKAGEKLFIPAGWFHFVFSEDADEKTGLNFAVNFWYQPMNNWNIGDNEYGVPYVRKHDLQVNPEELFGNEEINVVRSELNGLFPSDRNFSWFDRHKVFYEWMTYREFYESKNPKYYAIQTTNNTLTSLAPKHETELFMASAWINFGHARSQIHFDEHDNWLYQIQGTKRVLLFPHNERHLLYMKNPIPLDIYKEVLSFFDYPTNFIVIKNKSVVYSGNINQVYYEEISRYHKYKLLPVNSCLPDYKMPEKFKEIHTNHQVYSEIQPYPLNFIYIKEGKGTIYFYGHVGQMNVNSQDIILFPSSFLFPYEIKGNLKIVVPE